jgi:Na+-transporting NADH:ubiquinone oxidoreductase subunit NqrB
MRQYIRVLIQKATADPRHFQILALGSLLTLIFLWNDFAPNPFVFALTAAAALVTQFAFCKIFSVPVFDVRSPLITALGLTILLKSNFIWVLPLAVSVAMASKFLIRFQEKHIFNPGNFAIVLLLLLLPAHVWVSPGQWGYGVWIGFALLCLGTLVLSRARRGDIALFFLGSWAILVFGRALWLGDPLSIPMLSLQNGALLIFAFFMISDPKTIPDHRIGRLVFAAVTAIIGFTLHYYFQVREGIFYALFITCMMTPLLDKLYHAQRYQWGTR